MVSLSDVKSKKLAQVLSNDTSRRILEYLADKDDTEQNISRALKIPISTVHYNLSALVKGGLVEADEYHYSSRGKEVKHYKLANQFILIAPKATSGLKERLQGLLPAVGVLGGISLALQYFSTWSKAALVPAQPVAMQMMARSAPIRPETIAMDQAMAAGAEPVAEMAVEKLATEAVSHQALAEPISSAPPAMFGDGGLSASLDWSLLDIHNLGLIVFCAGLLSIAVYVSIDYLIQRKR